VLGLPCRDEDSIGVMIPFFSYVALQLFIEFWPSQPTLSIFLYLEQESSSLVLLAYVCLF